jgi:8-oxo-dGTP pyrophosphatase MutT (NUDIX family)
MVELKQKFNAAIKTYKVILAVVKNNKWLAWSVFLPILILLVSLFFSDYETILNKINSIKLLKDSSLMISLLCIYYSVVFIFVVILKVVEKKMLVGYTVTTIVIAKIEGKYFTCLCYNDTLKKWMPPGGHIKDNELTDEAIFRKVKQEVDIKTEEIELINSYNLFESFALKKIKDVKNTSMLSNPVMTLNEDMKKYDKDGHEFHNDFYFFARYMIEKANEETIDKIKLEKICEGKKYKYRWVEINKKFYEDASEDYLPSCRYIVKVLVSYLEFYNNYIDEKKLNIKITGKQLLDIIKEELINE